MKSKRNSLTTRVTEIVRHPGVRAIAKCALLCALDMAPRRPEAARPVNCCR